MKRNVLSLIGAFILFSGCDYVSENVDDNVGSTTAAHKSIDGTLPPSTAFTFNISPNGTVLRNYAVNIGEKSGKYVLSFNARIIYSKLAGSAYSLKIRVNGNIVTTTDLMNKAQTEMVPDDYNQKYKYTFIRGDSSNWFNSTTQSWSVFYAPDMDSNNIAGSGYRVCGGQATDYEFDVTDYITEGNNSIEISNINTAYTIEMSGLQMWKETAAFGETTLPQNNSDSFNTEFMDITKSYFIRFFARNIASEMAGFSYSLQLSLDSIYLFTKFDIKNKPLVANNYPNSSTKYNLCYLEQVLDHIEGWPWNPIKVYRTETYFVPLVNNNIFLLAYSPDFYSNDLAGPKNTYHVVGGEAYKYDLKIPSNLVTNGTHYFTFSNLNSVNYSLEIKKISVYEMTDINN